VIEEAANEERLRRHARYCVKSFAESSLKQHIESLVNQVNPYQDVRRIFKEELVAHRARSDEQQRSKEVDDDIKSRSVLGAA